MTPQREIPRARHGLGRRRAGDRLPVPAFDDRATNLYGALYYIKNTDNSYEEFVSAVFNLQPPMPAGTQRETFREVLTDALEDECSVNVVQNVHTASAGARSDAQGDPRRGAAGRHAAGGRRGAGALRRIRAEDGRLQCQI